MIEGKFRSRVDESAFPKTIPCTIGLMEKSLVQGTQVEIPDVMLARLISLGEAYELPVISRLDLYGDVSLSNVQCEGLLHELDFIFQIVNDDLLKKHLLKMKELTNKCIEAKGKYRMLVAGN